MSRAALEYMKCNEIGFYPDHMGLNKFKDRFNRHINSLVNYETKPKMKVIVHNGVQIFETVNRKKEWEVKRLKMI